MSAPRALRVWVSLFWLTSSMTGVAAAWDGLGHRVVGAIAWEHMSESTRKSAVELLLAAPTDAGLASLLPPGPRPMEVRAREFFMAAGYWPDMIRDDAWPERKQRYDRPTWHYVDFFWSSGPDGPVPLPDRGTIGDLLIKLNQLKEKVADRSTPASERGIALAWLLHLVGDIHQPLHDSGRVTEHEPNGDKGGNDFKLDDPEAGTLHALWDTILARARRQRHSESFDAWTGRIAAELMDKRPPTSFSKELGERSFAAWAKAGARRAMHDVYPPFLVREARPPHEYEEHAFAIAQDVVPLAGYRLAALLEEIL